MDTRNFVCRVYYTAQSGAERYTDSVRMGATAARALAGRYGLMGHTAVVVPAPADAVDAVELLDARTVRAAWRAAWKQSNEEMDMNMIPRCACKNKGTCRACRIADGVVMAFCELHGGVLRAAAAHDKPAPAAAAALPEPVLRPLVPEVEAAPATVVVRPSPRVARIARTVDPSVLLGAMNIEVARGIVEAFVALATRAAAQAATEAARTCYRCHEVKPMGYILDGQVCCRDCRGAHREAYYASRGEVAPRRQLRQRGPRAVIQTVAALHVRAEHVTVEPAAVGNA